MSSFDLTNLIVTNRYYMIKKMFFGRDNELNFLRKAYQSDKAEFIVLYGRRRVGKTELLKEFCQDKPSVFYSCRKYTDQEQLRNFSKSLLEFLYLSFHFY